MTKDEALQLALEALEEIGLKWPNVLEAIDAIKEALETKDEPVAMRYDFDGYGYKYIDNGSGSDWQNRIKNAEPLYATPQIKTKDEPLITVDDLEQEIYENTREFISFNVMKWMIKKFYTTPQRTWVGLSDEEMKRTCRDVFSFDPYEIAKAIEAKLKERNT
jgi:hypothetical protein